MYDPENIVVLPAPVAPQPLQQNDYTPFKDQDTPIVIDNGSSTLRYGFALDPATGSARRDPFYGPNVVSRFKDRKSNNPVLVFGDSVEFDSGARAQARNPWEGDVLLNFDALVSRRFLGTSTCSDRLSSRGRKTRWTMHSCILTSETRV